MKIVATIQLTRKINETLCVLEKKSKVFDDAECIYEITDWANSFVNRVGDIRFIPLENE